MIQTNFTEDQQVLWNSLINGLNVLVTGAAGVGKTYVLKKFIVQERERGRKILVCAPTGLAARNIGGETIHRTFCVPVYALDPDQNVTDPPQWVEEAEVIVIDEVSMVRLDLFDYVARSIKAAEAKSGIHKQLILVGDFFQLPPVIQNRETNALHHWYGGRKHVESGYAFMARAWNSFNLKLIELQTVVRQQDKKFSKSLSKLRVGSIAGWRWIVAHQATEAFPDAPWLCPTRRKVLSINLDALERLEGPSTTYRSRRSGIVTEDDMPADEVLTLKVGARVMILVNDPDGAYQNGSFGTVLELNPKSVLVKLDKAPKDKDIVVVIEKFTWLTIGYPKVCATIETDIGDLNEDDLDVSTTFAPTIIGRYTQIPLKLAYAFTIHKTQGQTFDFPVNIDVNVFCCGQLYTALSRVTKIEYIHIEGDPKSRYKPDSAVKKFYKNFQNRATMPSA